MEFGCSAELTALHAEYVAQLIEKKNFVSVTSGCEIDEIRSCDKSRNYVGVEYHEALKNAIETKMGRKIGDLCGISANGNPLTLGVCAEQHAANNVLNMSNPARDAHFDVSTLAFSKAMRPKGKKFISPCSNCSTIFS